MNGIFLDFTTVGWKDAVKEFISSVIKTAIAAVIAYVIARLNEVSIPLDAENASTIIAAIGLVRAALTSVSKWVTTSAFPATAPVVDQASTVG